MATIAISPRSCRYDLADRERDFALFQIPCDVVEGCEIEPNTKRLV